MCLMSQHESLSEQLTRLNDMRGCLEEALSHVRGIEDDYRRGSLEAHIRGAIREITAQRAELVSLPTIQRDSHTARAR
jgi:hypothetical protein